MKVDLRQYQDFAILILRLATAANFLSPVADRFGWWGKLGDPGVAWGNYSNFLEYASQLMSFIPSGLATFLAGLATGLEILLAVMLAIGFKTRLAALGSAALTLLFALCMTYSFGIKVPLDYAVFVDFTSALLLATVSHYKWSVDVLLTHAE